MTTNTNAETFKAFYEAERRAEDLEGLLQWLKAIQEDNARIAEWAAKGCSVTVNSVPPLYLDILISLVEQALKDL